MRQTLVEPDMKREESFEAVPAHTMIDQELLETANARITEARRQEDFKIAIEACTARILSIAVYGPDGPEAA